jgi:hypothetical protein
LEIPVSIITKYGVPIGTNIYNTSMNIFYDSDSICTGRELPYQDFVSCELNTDRIITVVGKIYSDNSYIVSFGDNFLYNMTKSKLTQYKISNIKETKDNRVICLEGTLPDMQKYFPDRHIMFYKTKYEVQNSSIGIARKFYGTYNKKPCIVKFSKIASDEDLYNEVLYKRLADLLNVPCCEVKLSKYYNKVCCISIYKYNIKNDYFTSFRGLNKSASDIIKGFDTKSKIDFDKIMILDFLVNQQDRHMSNIATCNGKMYPAFDNGECFNIGSIGAFSNNFRRYVLRLDKTYIKDIMQVNLDEVKKILPKKAYNIFVENYKQLR